MIDLRLPLASAEQRPLRILLSAYACEPDRGSEPGVGWRWAIELARAGHQVWVITRANNRAAIERALEAKPVSNLSFIYHDLPARWRGWKRGGRGVRLYYVLWQWGAYRAARRLRRRVCFDVVHHLTFGVFRHPSFMAFLGVPFVFGPVGGGETAPRSLRRTFPLRGYLADLARDVANWAVRLDPLMAAVYRRSAATLCKTDETLRCIPARYRSRCLVQIEVGTEEGGPAEPERREGGPLRILYTGRLLYWKGVHLGLMAFAKLRETDAVATLTVIGSGPDEAWLRALAGRLGIGAAVNWIPWMERAGVMQAYLHHDAFLFPSLHDSSGNAVLEALASGLPVVCLDAGGPALLVDASCGFRVHPGTPEQAVNGLAEALAALAGDPMLARAMGRAAMRRAREDFSWQRQVARMERVYVAACAGGWTAEQVAA